MSEKTDPAQKKYPGKIKTPTQSLEYSDKKWEQRVSKMKKKAVKPVESLPQKNKLTVGSLHGLTRKDVTQRALRESRKK